MSHKYVAGPNVITADGVIHFNRPIGKAIKVDGRVFPVTYNDVTRCFESYVARHHDSCICAGRTRAHLSAYIHMALFPQILG